MKLCILLFLQFVTCFSLLGQPKQWTSRGPGGGGALFLPSFNPHTSGDISIACDMSQSFRTMDYGAHWSQNHFQQFQTNNNRGCIQFTNDSNVLYTIDVTNIAGSDSYRPKTSRDGGKTWSLLAKDPTDAGAHYLYASMMNSSLIIVSDYANVYRSLDAGASWSLVYRTNNPSGIHIAGVVSFSNEIFIGLSTGILLSENSGQSFSYRTDVLGLDTTSQAIFSFSGAQLSSPKKSTTLIAAVHAAGDVYGGVTALDKPAFSGIYTLNWDSKKWAKKTNGISTDDQPYFVAMPPNSPQLCYAAGGSSNSVPTVYVSSDAGENWTQSFRVNANQNIATGWSGSGGDRAWSYGELALGFALNPSNPREAIFTDYGFAHLTTDAGTNWRQVYVDASTQNAAGANTPRGKSYKSVGIENTTCWQLVWLDSANVYGCYSDIQGTRSTDAGVSWGFNYTGHTDNSLYYVLKDPQTGIVYGATSTVHDMYQSTYLQDARIDNGKGKVLFSTNNGATWQLMHDFLHPVIWLARDPTRVKRLYASVVHSTQGGVYVCDDIELGVNSHWNKLVSPPRTEGHPFNLVVLADGSLVASYSGRRDPSGKFTASSGVFVWDGKNWSDRSDASMYYWTKDIVIDPSDATQNTWYVCVFSGWGGAPNGKGGLYKTTNRGTSWTKINSLDRVSSVRFNPLKKEQAYMTTETEGLWYYSNINTPGVNPVLVDSYPFRQPERVFFNPYKKDEVWISSFGNGLKKSMTADETTLEPPQLLLPHWGSTLKSRRVIFSWKSTWSVASYKIQVSKDASFSGLVTESQILPSSHFYFFADGGDYYWRVKSYSPSDSSIWSSVEKIRVPLTINPSSLLNPPCSQTNVSIPSAFRWASILDAQSYRLVIGKDRSFNPPIIDSSFNSTTTAVIIPGLINKTLYYWFVENRGNGVGGESSDTCAFTTSDIGSSLSMDEAMSMVQVVPNPTHSLAAIRIYSVKECEARIDFVNELGISIHNQNCHLVNGTNEITLDLTKMPKGFYVIQLQSNQGQKMGQGTIIIE